MSVLSVDLGGTNCRVAVVGDDGTVHARVVHATSLESPRPDTLVAAMRELAPGCTRAVVGVPGRVDHARGALDHAPNLPPAWAPHLMEASLGDAVGLPVHLANDADLAAVGEAWFGAGRPYTDIVYVTFSTGVGAGVLLGRRLVRGRRSIAEAGHTILDEAAFVRGMPATLEERASGTGLARAGRWLGLDLDGAALVRAAGSDPRARRVFDLSVQAAAIGVRNLAYCFSPEVVIVGGGFGLVGEPLWGPIRAHLRAYGPPGLDIVVTGAELGDAAGVVGAAGWAAATQGG